MPDAFSLMGIASLNPSYKDGSVAVRWMECNDIHRWLAPVTLIEAIQYATLVRMLNIRDRCSSTLTLTH